MKGSRVKVRFMVGAVLLGVIGLAAVSGCGGGGSSNPGSGASSSASSEGGSSFASGAEAACTAADKQIAALGTPQQEEVLKYLESTEDVMIQMNEEVAALDASSAADTAYAEGLAKAVPVLNEMTNAARNENFDAVREISDELVEFKLGELAETAELTACAEVTEASA